MEHYFGCQANTYGIALYEEHNNGIIINVSSNSTYAIVRKNATYSGSKAFIKQFTHGVFMDMKDYNIKVLLIEVYRWITKNGYIVLSVISHLKLIISGFYFSETTE